MKKKIAVDDQTYKLVKEYASKNSLRIGIAANKLIRKGLGFRIANEILKELESELEIVPNQG